MFNQNFDLLNDNAFLETKFNFLPNELLTQYNIKDFQNINDIDFNPINHINHNNNTLITNKKINFTIIINYLKNNNINLPETTVKDCFYTYLQHNNVSNLKDEMILTNFLKMIKFYNQFYKRATPIYNNQKQNKQGFMEEKHSEIDNDLQHANGFSKAMKFQNDKYLNTNRFTTNNNNDGNNNNNNNKIYDNVKKFFGI